MTTFTAMPKYEAYKDSGVEWLGDIPSHWNCLSNKNIFKIRKSLVGKHSSEYELLSLTLRGIIKRDMDNPEGKFPAEFNTYQEVRVGDFVFCLFDVEETPRTVGLSDFNGMITGAYTVFEVNNNFDKKFLYYFYLNLDQNKRLKPLYRGLRNTIPKDSFMAFKSFVPSKIEQTAIANFLDEKTVKIDEAIAIKEKQIELLKERKQIIIQQAVTQGLDPTVPMKDSGVEWIGKIPAHWEVIRLKDICKAYGRIGFRGYTASDLVNAHEGAITLSPSNIIDSEMNYEKCSYLSWEKYFESPEIMIKNTDIILVKTGSSYGKSAIVKSLSHEATINPQLLVIKDILISAFYLHYLMTSVGFLSVIDSEVIGSTIPTISENKIMNIKIAVPGNDEQLKIVEYLDLTLNEVTKGIENIDSQVEKLKEYKTTLINSAVTGKIKVV